MSRPLTQEERILLPARRLLEAAVRDHSSRLLVLEAVASRVGGFSFFEFQRLFHRPAKRADSISRVAERVLELIRQTEIPIPLAVASLAREPVPEQKQKETGSFYTDYRLANLVAEQVVPTMGGNSTIADLSSGTGILLAAVAVAFRNRFGDLVRDWIANNLFAFDLSDNAIRGTIASLSCLLSTINDIRRLSTHCKVCDSLLDTANTQRFDVIVGNPPWGRIRLTRYAFAKLMHTDVSYGGDYGALDAAALTRDRNALEQYVNKLRKRFPLMGSAEPDYYIAFLAATLKKLNPGGTFSIIIPAGLIRSQGTIELRRYLFTHICNPAFKLLDNKPCFFSIDTRFKFLVFSGKAAEPRNGENNSVSLSFLRKDDLLIRFSRPVLFPLKELQTIRPDLSIPECRTKAEKNLFVKLCSRGKHLSDFSPNTSIMREIDMTLDRKLFVLGKTNGTFPIVEGRMIQPHRFGAKSYQSGAGRKAVWTPAPYKGTSQFSIRKGDVPQGIYSRISILRAGFCDIAGQTNERAMMSALIPPGVVCGNKVPTIVFDNGKDQESLFLWIGLSNSFVFDWLLRRTITTTVNFFLLEDTPLPSIPHRSSLGRTIIRETKTLAKMKSEFYTDNLSMSRCRARIDALAAKAYGLTENEMVLILTDFPLLDRGQPALPSESRSTITRDMVLSAFCTGPRKRQYTARVHQARKLGANAYVLSEMRTLTQKETANE